jgi:hypothetical protein
MSVGTINELGMVTKEYFQQGYIYKNADEFKPGGDICYIPELTGDIIKDYPLPEGYKTTEDSKYVIGPDGSIEEFANTYKYDDFIRLAGGNEDMAQLIYDLVDWQSPESLINADLEGMGIINCENCNWMYDTEENTVCPKCNTVN